MQKKHRNNYKNRNYFYKFNYKKNNSLYLRSIAKRKENQNKINNQDRYLYKNRKLKKGIFLKKPKFREVMYPFYLNAKLINEYLKKN